MPVAGRETRCLPLFVANPSASTTGSLLACLAILTASAIGLQIARLDQRPFLGLSEHGRSVAVVHGDGPAARAGLLPGDELIAIEDRSVMDLADPFARLRAEGLRPTRLTVLREGAPREILLEPVALPPSEHAWQVGQGVVALTTLLIGTIVVTRRATRLSIVFFALCYVLALLLFRFSTPDASWALRATSWAIELFSALLPALLVHFFLLFPYTRAPLVTRPWLAAPIYLPGLALFTLSVLVAENRWLGPLDPAGMGALLLSGSALYAMIAISVALTLYLRAFRTTPLPTVRRKLRVTLLGTILGLLPLLVVVTLRLIQPTLNLPGDRAATLAVVLLPASFGYAIVRHGVFEREVFVQRVLVYAALTALFLLTYLFSSVLLGRASIRLPFGQAALGSLLLAIFVIVVMSPLRQRLQDRVDRWIYPDRYDTHRALRESALALRGSHSAEEVAMGLLHTVESALGARRATLFRPVGSGDSFALVHTLEAETNANRSLRLGRLLADPLFRIGRPMTREEFETELPYGFLPPSDLEALRESKARVIAPIASGARRLGILVLGARAYREAYTPPDLVLLDGLIAQAALALDNAIYRQASHGHADLQREMETARTLQQQLLPHALPHLARFDLAARNLSCKEVGGDYYDCLSVEGRDGVPQEITVAIGDVSGKGVPAALLMANVQATFRSEATRGQAPDEVLVALNRRLCVLERPDRFISFFCARLEAGRRRLRYANAGHPPPLLLRGSGTIDRLERGGLLLGIRDGERYESGEVTLDPGDLLILYTDGVVERGGAGSTFGETELELFASRHRHLGAEDLLERILEELGRQSPGEPDDDTTLVILKAL